MKTTNKLLRAPAPTVKEQLRRMVSPPAKENMRDGSPKQGRLPGPAFSQDKPRATFKNVDGERRHSALRRPTEESQREAAVSRSSLLDRPRTPVTRLSMAPFCMNHPHKRAVFKIEDEGVKKFLCGKCALIFNKQGLDCEELSEDEEEERGQRLLTCLEMLKVEKRRADATHTELVTRTERHLASDLTHVKHINKHFDMIIAHVQRRREAELRHAKETRDELRQFAKTTAAALKRVKAEFADFQADIEQNFDSIVKKVEMDVFNVILGRYQTKADAFREYVQSVAARSIEVVPSSRSGAEMSTAVDEACGLSYQLMPLLDEEALGSAAYRISSRSTQAMTSVEELELSRPAAAHPRFSPLPTRSEPEGFFNESHEVVKRGWEDKKTPELDTKTAKPFAIEEENARYNKSLFPATRV